MATKKELEDQLSELQAEINVLQANYEVTMQENRNLKDQIKSLTQFQSAFELSQRLLRIACLRP